MRAFFLVTGTCLALSACGAQDGTDNGASTAANLASETIIANDTTVIDAATGDAANMAADVDYSANSSSGNGDVRSDGTVDRRTVSRRQAADAEAASNVSEAETQIEPAAETNAL